MKTIWQDVRYSVRVLLKHRWFTLVAVLTLALGICGVTAQFSIVDAALLRGLPFPEPDRLVKVTMRDPMWAPERERNPWISDVIEFGKQTQSFDGLAGYLFAGSAIVNINGVPQRLSGCSVTDNFFSVLGVNPILGRNFTAADNREDAESVAIISYAIWQTAFGGDPNVIGRHLRLNGRPTTVVGVMPPNFEFPRDQIWVPYFKELPCKERPCSSPHVLARLRSNVSAEQARVEFETYLQRLAKDYPRTNERFTVSRIEPLLNGFIARPTKQLLMSMLGVVVAVLLIACANVMNMQFARNAARTSEFAMRNALGASRRRLVQQMLTEGLVIAAIGGAAGVGLAYWAIDLFSGLMGRLPVDATPFWMQFRIDRRVLALTVVATAASVVLSALLPAILASRTNLVDVLKAGARGQTSRVMSRLSSGLVIGQIALTCALLISSLLLIKSIVNQSILNFGFNLDSVLAGRVNFDVEYPKVEDRRAALRNVLMGFRSNPQFTHAAFSSRRLMMTNDDPSRFEIEGQTYQRPEDRLQAWEEVVSDRYFETLNLKVIHGREFELADRDERQFVALVNESFQRKYFPNEVPIGRRLRHNERDQWRTIVGVVPDTLMQGPIEQERDGVAVFTPLEAAPLTHVTLVVRGRVPPSQLSDAVRRELLEENPNLAIYLLDTPRNLLKGLLVQSRSTASLFAAFGLVAILLSAVGLYGITAFSVHRRTQEFGIRMALGAQRRSVLFMVLRQGTLQLMTGLALGIALTLAIVRLGGAFISSFLYQVSPYDPLIYGMVIMLLAVATLLACLIPARRATKVDPLVALRYE
jgi:predicted permease